MATSGARVQLALAPAGTGKTTAMAALAAAWANSGGNVIGLAPTASAAEILAEDTRRHRPTPWPNSSSSPDPDRRRGPRRRDDPARKWFNTIGPNDPAHRRRSRQWPPPSTSTPSSATRWPRGASVRLVGDDQQLASISAGGVIRDIAERHGTLTLSTWSASPTRLGAPKARPAWPCATATPPASPSTSTTAACMSAPTTIAADMAYPRGPPTSPPGRDSILLAPTNELVAELNERARLDRLTNDRRRDIGAPSPWRRPDRLGRRLDRHPQKRPLAAPQRQQGWVKNGHRWVIRRRPRRRLASPCHPLRGRANTKTVRLPARYVTAHTTLGYARTIDSAQGVTAGGATSRHLPHRRLRPPHPPTALRRPHPRQNRKPHLLLHRRSRPAPHPGAQSHPPPDRRRHPHRHPAPRRRPSLRTHRRRRRTPTPSPGFPAPPTCTPTR